MIQPLILVVLPTLLAMLAQTVDATSWSGSFSINYSLNPSPFGPLLVMQPHHALLLPPAVVRYLPLPSWCLHIGFLISCVGEFGFCGSDYVCPPPNTYIFVQHHHGVPSSAWVVVILLHQTPSLPANRTRYVKTLRCVFATALFGV